VQFEETFESIGRALDDAGFRPEQLVRTWFVLDPILPTYSEFNRVRSLCFRTWGLDSGQVPASTAVGAVNPWRASAVAGVLAIEPRREQVFVSSALSPLQGPASGYGSLFSRATAVRGPGGRHLFVSGTASIDATGATQHPFDEAAQFEETLAVLGALIAANGFEWRDVKNLTAYFESEPSRCYATRLSELCPGANVYTAVADLCRDDLRCEVELELVSLRPGALVQVETKSACPRTRAHRS